MFLALFTSKHFFKMLGYFTVAAALTLLLGFSMSAGSLLAGLISAVIIGGVGMVFGLGSTIVLRSRFSLMQTGRFIQYACFLLGTWFGVKLAAPSPSHSVPPLLPAKCRQRAAPGCQFGAHSKAANQSKCS
jgi:hypothetical protein